MYITLFQVMISVDRVWVRETAGVARADVTASRIAASGLRIIIIFLSEIRSDNAARHNNNQVFPDFFFLGCSNKLIALRDLSGVGEFRG